MANRRPANLRDDGRDEFLVGVPGAGGMTNCERAAIPLNRITRRIL